MKLTHFFAAFIIVMLCCSIACAFTASYEQTTSGPGIEKPQTRAVKIKDNKVRMDMDLPQGRGMAIIDSDNMYLYNPAEKVAVKLKTPKSADLGVLSNYASYLKSLNAKIVGSETVGPYDCDIYEFMDPYINVPSKIWLWKAHEFPVKVEIKTPNGVTTTIMDNVKVGIPIDDSEFVLPAGVDIKEEAEMME